MGLLKILVVGAAGFISARSILRLHRKVPRIRVPLESSLNRIANSRGDSYADTFVIKLPVRTAHSNLPIRVDDFAKSFYESFVFRSFEKPLLKLAFSLKEPSLEHIQFGPGDKVLLWTVTERTLNEIVLEWQSGGFRGCTWFHVSPDQRHLMFGSSIGYWKTLYKTKYHTDVSPLQLLLSSVDQLKNNPYEQNLGERLLQSFQRTGFASVIGVHQLYSRLLLQSALKALVLEASS